MIYLTSLGLKKGDVNKLLSPIDGDNRFCGVNHQLPEGESEDGFDAYDYSHYRKLMITDFSSANVASIFSSGVCVKECPKAGGADPAFKPTAAVAALPDGAKYLVDTRSVMGICIPTSISQIDGGQEAYNAMINVFTNS